MKLYSQVERLFWGMAVFAAIVTSAALRLMSISRSPKWLGRLIFLPADLLTGYRLFSLS